MSEERVQYTQWLKRSNNTFMPADNSKTQSRLDAGIYSINFADGIGFYLLKKSTNLDELIKLPSKETDEVMDGIKAFWDRKDKFKEYGYAYKRGILLYGVPGGGKTSIINMLCKHLTENMNGVVFTISNGGELSRYTSFMPEIYRVIETDRPIITIIEDIDGLCRGSDDETALINVLDGINQLENVVYIATTNYMERLSERITNRPSRFDRRIEVKYPSAEARRLYFQHKLKEHDLKSIDLEYWVQKTAELTMAHLGEIVKSVIILGNDFDKTIEILESMKSIVPSIRHNRDEVTGPGFKIVKEPSRYPSLTGSTAYGG